MKRILDFIAISITILTVIVFVIFAINFFITALIIPLIASFGLYKVLTGVFVVYLILWSLNRKL